MLHIGKFYFPFFGGIEKVTQDLVESKEYQTKVSTMVLAHQEDAFVPTRYKEFNNVEIRKVKCIGRMIYAPIAPFFLHELNKAINDFSPDIIHIHLPNLSAFACLFSSKAKRIPWIIHWHADVLGNAPDKKVKLFYPIYRLFERQLLSRAKSVVVTSPPYLAHSESLKSYENKCVIIPIGLKDKLGTSSVNISLNKSHLDLLMIGRLTYYKGHELLIRALALLPPSFNVTLNIIGKGELQVPLQTLVDELSINDRVRFLGSVDDNVLNHYLINSDLLCLPSIEKTEAFGVVLLEAAMYSKPCLVTDVLGSGMSWVVQDNNTGYVVPNNNVEALAKKLSYIYSNKYELISFGKNARCRFEQVFSINKVAENFVALYESCLE